LMALLTFPHSGNAAEHVTAVTVAYKDKLDLSIGVAVGSSIQYVVAALAPSLAKCGSRVALFIIPVLVLLGWCLDKPLSLLFDPFQSIVLFLSVLIVNYTTVRHATAAYSRTDSCWSSSKTHGRTVSRLRASKSYRLTRSAGLEGAILVMVYIIIATVVWFLPENSSTSVLFESQCT
jgi:Ca2+/H+ antiporter